MGIKFYCPNGHKLNVKTFLAGKRGICPQCSARFRIPEKTQIPRGSPKVRPAENAESPTPGPAMAQLVTIAANSSGAPELTAEHPPATWETGADPISAAPDAVWYVRPPTGGQFGPARGDVIQRWIAEGRVSAETLVWREGWTEWLAAGPLFPHLSSTTGEAPPSDPGITSASLTEIAEAAASATPSSARRSTPAERGKSIAIVVTLTFLAIALSIALITVLQGTK